MLLPKFDFHEPSTINEVCRIMAELGREARPIAGGTDMIVNMKKGLLSPKHVVSLSRINDLKEMDPSNGTLVIGACLTAAELAESDEIKKTFSALASGAASLGSPLIRNLATIGGNLGSSRPAADLPPSLIAYGASVVLKKASGERVVPLKDFFRGPGQTVMAPDEILTQVIVDEPPPCSGAGYIKLGVRKALEISLVNVAAFLSLDGLGGVVASARVVLGAVAPVPMRAPSAEQALMGEKPSDGLFAKAGEAAARDSRPIDDFRGSAEYRRAMVQVLTQRALKIALENAKGNG